MQLFKFPKSSTHRDMIITLLINHISTLKNQENIRFHKLILEAVTIIRDKSTPDITLSFSGGADSTLLNALINMFNLSVTYMFVNKEVENKHNKDIIKKVSKSYITHYAKTRSYRDICYTFGFPIQNKDFSHMCYRVKRLKHNNFIDRFRIVTGISPNKLDLNNINKSSIYSLDLKFWYFALNNPVQSECCRILKKAPSKVYDKPMIIGVMKSDSPNRRKAITDNFNSNKKDKIFPLANWNKSDVLKFLKLYNIETSKIYQDRVTKSGVTVCGVNGSGCEGCHFGNKDGHCYINENGVKEKTTKFENLQREFPKKHKALMRMTHKSNLTYQDVLDNYADAKAGNQITKSIIVRNEYINKIIDYMELDDRDFTDAITHIRTFII